MITMTFEEAHRDLRNAVSRVLHGEGVIITVGSEAVRLDREMPFRPPGYFAPCYSDLMDAAFEERIGHDSKPVLEA